MAIYKGSTKISGVEIVDNIDDENSSASSTYSSNKIDEELDKKQDTIATLPIANGGTGKTTATEACAELGAVPFKSFVLDSDATLADFLELTIPKAQMCSIGRFRDDPGLFGNAATSGSIGTWFRYIVTAQNFIGSSNNIDAEYILFRGTNYTPRIIHVIGTSASGFSISADYSLAKSS